MKKFTKVTLLTGAVCIAAGLILSAILCIGFLDEIISHRDELSINSDNYWKFFEIEDYYKITRIGTHYSKEDAHYSYSFDIPGQEQVTDIDFEFAVGKVNVITGDTFSVRVEDMFENAISSEVKHGVWYIKDSLMESGSVFSGYAPDIEITVPADYLFESISIRMEAGDFYADELNGRQVELEVAAGRMRMDKLAAEESITLTNGVGETDIYSLTGRNLMLDNGIGSVSLSGSLTGNNKIDCGIGEVKLVLTDRSRADFGYSVDCGIGQVVVDGASYSGTVKQSDYNRGEGDFFDLTCGIGRIEIRVQ
ncbi:MAG: DUF4097 family beta strand repeat-containing protein [Lachnospiraceae bacterium]